MHSFLRMAPQSRLYSRNGQLQLGNPEVRVYSDHKSLITIFQNSRKGSVRIERIKLRHQDIAYSIHHLKGAINPADFCSRNPVPWEKLPQNIEGEADDSERLDSDRLLYHLQNGGITSTIGPDQQLDPAI